MAELGRRELIKKTAMGTAAASVCLCGLNGCASYTKIGRTSAATPESYTVTGNVLTVDLSKEPNLSRVGGAAKILHPRIPGGLIIAHADEDRFEVVSLLCTHRGVEVEYRHQLSLFQCASIGSSRFTMDGETMSGPAPRPLRAYDAVVRNGTLTISI